jgi:hypothetical protein
MRHHGLLLSIGLSAAILGVVVGARRTHGQAAASPTAAPPAASGTGSAADPTRDEIIREFTKASTGNVADAVDEATGQRGFMFRDMKPIYKAKIIGQASTAVLRAC